MKTSPKRIFVILLAPLLLLGVFLAIKWTHGLVLFDIYAHKSLEFNADAGNGITVEGRIDPSEIIGESKGHFNIPKFEEKAHLGLFSRARPRGSFVRITFISEEPLIAAQVDTLRVTGIRGKNAPIEYQKEKLEPTEWQPLHEFTSIDYHWHGIYIEGSAEIEISGKAILKEGNKDLPFQVTIPIECLHLRTIMTRKKWDEFFEGAPSIWAGV